MEIKGIVCTAAGAAGAVVSALFGGWNGAMTTLVIFMAADYLMGITVAAVFHKSPKSETGRLESGAGMKGLIRKAAMLAAVVVACRLEILTGTDYIKDGVITAFCANELISVTENLKLMGVPLPKIVSEAIETIKNS